MLKMRNQGHTFAAIAKKYDCSITNVKSTVDRFRAKIERINKQNGNQN